MLFGLEYYIFPSATEVKRKRVVEQLERRFQELRWDLILFPSKPNLR